MLALNCYFLSVVEPHHFYVATDPNFFTAALASTLQYCSIYCRNNTLSWHHDIATMITWQLYHVIIITLMYQCTKFKIHFLLYKVSFQFKALLLRELFAVQYIRDVLLFFFRFVSKQMCLFRLFRNGSETPKQTETNRKNVLLVSRNKPKINRNSLSFGLFRFEPKIFVCLFRGHPMQYTGGDLSLATVHYPSAVLLMR
jgi:hypothetical protein